MAGRAYGLEKVLEIQRQARVDFINPDEEARIREMWELDMWPQKWSSDDINADVPIDALQLTDDGRIVRQSLLIN